MELCNVYIKPAYTAPSFTDAMRENQMSLWEKKRHITNTKIKTLGNKVNTESKNWE